MFKLNKADREILEILKDVFLTKHIRPISSDHHMRIWIIRSLFAVSLSIIILRIFVGLKGEQFPAEVSSFFSFPIALFFGALFLHINNESENTSLLVFILTWISIVIALYL